MGHLYWSCLQEVQEELLHLLTEKGRDAIVVGSGNGTPIISVSRPDSQALRLTADLLARQRIVSTAFTSGPLLEDNLWIAAEWLGRMVVEPPEVSRIEPILDRLELEGERSELNLVIFRVDERVTLPPEEARVFHEEGVVGTRVRENPHEYFGCLAGPMTGGASALYAAGFEAARARHLPGDRIIVASPEVLGFRLDLGKNSAVRWQRKSAIAVKAVGFCRDSITEAADLFGKNQKHLDGDELKRKFDDWHEEGLEFAIAVVLRGLDDPPVVIPVGSVYQQPTVGSRKQNLAIAKSATPIVAAGASVPLILPAWCLNQTLLPPRGPVLPTPLISVAVGGTQQEVWERIDSHYRGHQ